MATTDKYAGWLPLPEVKARLGISERSIYRLVTDGKLRTASRPMPGRRPLVVYCPQDVDELEAVMVKPQVMLPNGASGGNGITTALARRDRGKDLEPFARLAEALAASGPRLAPDRKLFLTVVEAAEYSGLPQAHLRRLMAEGKLDGLKTGAGWRIRRADLEKV